MKHLLLTLAVLLGLSAGTIQAQEAVSAPQQLSFTLTFSQFAKKYIVKEVNRWQQKTEFEKTSEWRARVNEETRKAKVADLVKITQQKYIEVMSERCPLQLQLQKYDADREVYLITDPTFGNLLVKVPIAEAPQFKANWTKMAKEPEYTVKNDRLALAKLSFTIPGGKVYAYNSELSLDYKQLDIDYEFDPIYLDLEGDDQEKGQQKIEKEKIGVGRSDVDLNIPVVDVHNDRTFVLVIANERYMNFSKVNYAKNDGKFFIEYCQKTLGVPKDNIRYYPDATYGMMRGAMKNIRNIVEACQGKCKILVYYTGHGAPDETAKKAYLLPTDTYGIDPYTCYALEDFYRELSDLKAQQVVAFLDACFSGVSRSGEALVEGRSVGIRPKRHVPQGNVLVYTASSSDEIAMPYHEKGHGLFTYYLLKCLQETRGDITCGGLADYLLEKVRLRSNLVNQKNQTPNVVPGLGVSNDWKQQPLR